MSHEIRNIIKIACIYAATVIGAGFASGQEIVQFFTGYYKGGFYGIITAGILFSLTGFIVLDRVYRDRIRSFDELVFPSFGWFMGWVVEIGATLFMFCLFCVMIAGSSAVLSQKLGLHKPYAVIFMCLLCMIFITASIKGVVILSTIVTPVLVIGILFIGFYIIIFRDTSVFFVFDHLKNITNNWFFSSLLYVGYNSIMSMIIMCSLLPYLKTRRTGKIGGVLGGLILCFAALVINTAVSMFYSASSKKELPILDILSDMSSLLENLYAIVLWLAMLLSAVNAGFCFTDRVCQRVKLTKNKLTVLMCIAAAPLSMFGFSELIARIYPMFGYIGLFMVFCILISGIRLFAEFCRGLKQ